jgi:hypothetical protein
MVLSNSGPAQSWNEMARGSSGSGLSKFAEKKNSAAASSRDFRTTGCCSSAVAAHKSARRSNSSDDCSAQKAASTGCCRRGTAHRRLPRAVDRSSYAPLPATECLPGGSNCRSLGGSGHDRSYFLALPKSAGCFRSAVGRCSSRCLSCGSNWASLKADDFATVRAAALSYRNWPANSARVGSLLRSRPRRNCRAGRSPLPYHWPVSFQIVQLSLPFRSSYAPANEKHRALEWFAQPPRGSALRRAAGPRVN